MTTSYKHIKRKLIQSEFVSSLIKETKTRLSSEHLQLIGSYEVEEGILLAETNPQIYIWQDFEAFANQATLRDHRFQHSWAGENLTIEEGVWLIGEGLFGIDEHHTYSDNGNVSSSSTKHTEPDFNVYKTQVIVLKAYQFNDLNINTTFKELSYSVEIYLPDEDLQPYDEKVQTLLEVLGLI